MTELVASVPQIAGCAGILVASWFWVRRDIDRWGRF